MTAKPSHAPGAGCDCREQGAAVVDFECAAVWTLHKDGYRPVSNPTQNGIGIHQIGVHRVAEPGDYNATKGALRGSFIFDGSPVDSIRYPNRALAGVAVQED
jgi:hypothetical protein